MWGFDGTEGSHRAPASSPKGAGALLRSNQRSPFNADRSSSNRSPAAISTGESGAVRRDLVPAVTLARAKQVLAAVSTVLEHSEAIDLTVNQD